MGRSQTEPGVAQMVERVVWDHEAAGSKPVTRTKNPLRSSIPEVFLLFLCLLRRKNCPVDLNCFTVVIDL